MASRIKDKGKDKKNKILEYIKVYITIHGYAPTVREIGEGTGLRSTSCVHGYLADMFWEGTLETDAPGSPRAIRVPGMHLEAEERRTHEESKKVHPA